MRSLCGARRFCVAVPLPLSIDQPMAMSLLAARSIDPWSIVPQDFDFGQYQPQKAQRTQPGPALPKEEQSVKNLLQDKAKVELPQRLYLTAYSCKFGTRLSGMRHGPALQEYVSLFRDRFNRASLPRITLPCDGSRPFVCPDRLLPCPHGLVIPALRLLGEEFAQVKPEDLTEVQKEILSIWKEGLPVEWYVTTSYINYVIYQESASMQADRKTQVQDLS